MPQRTSVLGVSLLALGLTATAPFGISDGCAAPAPQANGTTPAAAPRIVTQAHSGRTFGLRRGQPVSLRLNSVRTWSEPTVRGRAVTLTQVDYFQDPGYREWELDAASPGTATIEATGRTAGGAVTRFKLTIVVRR